MEQMPFLRSYRLLSYCRKAPHCLEPEGS